MAEQRLTITDFSGGFGRVSAKKDIPAAAQFVKGLSPYEDPTYLTPFPKAEKVSGTTVVALPKWLVDGSPWDSNRYMQDEEGNLYKEDSAGTWSLLRSAATIEAALTTEGAQAGGYGLALYGRFLYYAADRQIGMYGPLDGTPSFDDDGILAFHASATQDQSLSTSGNTYTLPTAISEAATARQTFTPTKEALSAIAVTVAAKGTGNWTLTVHDAANNVIATATLSNAQVSVGVTTFRFTGATLPRLMLGADYHFHLTVSTGTSTVTTTTASDLETVAFTTYASVLIPGVDYHPMRTFLNYLCIGNDQYLAVWDESTLFYNPCALVLPSGFQIRTLAQDQEFLVIGAAKGEGLNVEDAYLFYWDGIAPTFNFYKQVPMGLPNALHNSKNRLMGVYGLKGDLYLGSDPFQRVQRLPKLGKTSTVEVHPGAITEWQGLTMIGAGESSDADFPKGVYGWGGQVAELPEVGVFAIPISTGTTTAASLEIGLVQGIGESLYVGWKDGADYGVDRVQLTNDPTPAFTYESLIFDNGNPQKQKLALMLEATVEPMTAGDSYQLKYRIDRGAWSYASAVTSPGTTKLRMPIFKRFCEIEFGFDGETTSSTYPKITSLALAFDGLTSEGNNG